MMLRLSVLSLLFSLFFLTPTGSAADDILLNGTDIYLVTGDSYGLHQGYILSLKSVSGDGSVWLQLTHSDKIVKSDVVYLYGYFMYNTSNKTVLSVRVDKVYSGSSEQNLVSLFPVYQFTDPGLPAPDVTEIALGDTRNPVSNNPSVRIHTPGEPLIWTLGILFILVLFYILRKLW